MNTSYIKNLTAHILIYVSAICVAVLSACSDDIDFPTTEDCPVGMPAEITLSLDLGDMAVISRDELADGLDNKITSLWVAAYRADGSKELLASTTVNKTVQNEFHENFGSVTLDITSGPTYIVAVANYDHRMASIETGGSLISLSEALAGADSWDKFCDIAVFFDNQGNTFIDAPANPLVMSGFYTEQDHSYDDIPEQDHSSGDRPELSVLTVKPGKNTPPGKIHLRRMISQVKFNISFDHKNIKSCDISSWQVYNLPSNAWLHEPDKDDVSEQKPLNSFDVRKAPDHVGYNNSVRRTDISESKEIFSFDFWQLENKRTGINSAASDYASREKEYKNADGSNSGKYVSLVDAIDSTDPNNNATYVVFHAILEMNVDQDGKSLGTTTRIVETDYTVHLGYVKGVGNDFNCFRNSKYTYTVNIKNVGDLYVEAVREGDNEKAPGVEGSISDITEVYYELDAHYAAINVELTDLNLQDFNYYISATRLDGTEIIINSREESTVPASTSDDYKYLTWVEFRKTDEGKLASYKPRTGDNSDKQTYTLDEIKALSKQKAFTSGWYTMFINEYVYEKTTAADGNEYGSENWKGYVNRRPRRMWLIVKSEVSPDNESVYFESKYAVSQKSIQCYYNVNAKDLESALGIEHENETFGLALRNDFNYFVKTVNSYGEAQTFVNTETTPGRNDIAGRYNIAQYIAGSTDQTLNWNYNPANDNKDYMWNTYLNVNSFQYIPAINKQGVNIAAHTEQLPQIMTQDITEIWPNNLATYEPSTSRIQAITACLNRNRDLNGDGLINAGELRWFVPTSSQSLRIILGRQSLEDPLLDPKDIDRLSDTNNGYNTRLMFYTSNGKNLWAMEGTSLSQHRQWPNSVSSPWEVRCVRNLGSNMTQINSAAANTPAFKKVDGKNIVDLSLSMKTV